MSSVLSKEKNVLGGPLLACSYDPLTGFFRDGCCATHDAEGVAHLVCIKTTEEFLEFSRSRGNDLSTPRPEMRFRAILVKVDHRESGNGDGFVFVKACRCPKFFYRLAKVSGSQHRSSKQRVSPRRQWIHHKYASRMIISILQILLLKQRQT